MINLSENAFEILKSAVTIAKERQCQSVESLRMQLRDRFPGEDKDIDDALKYWGNYIESTKRVVDIV